MRLLLKFANRKQSVRHIATAAALLVSAVAARPLAAFDGFSSPARNVVVPLFTTNRPQPFAFVKAGRVYEDFQRAGFFRIGALPVLALDDIHIRVPDPADAALALSKATAALDPRVDLRRVLDGRGVEILVGTDPRTQIRARRLRVLDAATWQLDDVVVARGDEAPTALSRGWLHTSGPRAGEFTGSTKTGALRLNLSRNIP
jgi:hypothetical protein